jgi:upstream activation factor subunit UAF30
MEQQDHENETGYVYILIDEETPDKVLIDTKKDWPEIHTQLVFGDDGAATQYELGYVARVDDVAGIRTAIEAEFEEDGVGGEVGLYDMDLQEAIHRTESIRTTQDISDSDSPYTKTGFMKPLFPDSDLSPILGVGPMARTEAVKRIWDYIKYHDLQDKTTKRLINTDDRLRVIFEEDQVSMFAMTKLLMKHLKARPDGASNPSTK